MTIEIREESPEKLPEYAEISIAFQVVSRFRIEPLHDGLSGFTFAEEPVAPFIKDYDAIAGEGPQHWQTQYNLANWGVLSAFEEGRRIGGAAVVWKTAGFSLLDGHDDTAILLDLRVHPDARGRGVGRLLFDRAVSWARDRHCRCLIIETQNINVPACRFYARQGCELGSIHRFAYGAEFNEVQLLWYKMLWSERRGVRNETNGFDFPHGTAKLPLLCEAVAAP
jgi:ribosomal protein S18 acetylase RimI-like enzyme